MFHCCHARLDLPGSQQGKPFKLSLLFSLYAARPNGLLQYHSLTSKDKTHPVSKRIFQVTVHGKEIFIDEKFVNLVLSRLFIIEGKFT